MKKKLDQIGKFLLHTAIFFMVAMVVLQGAVTLQPLNLFAGWSEKMSGGQILPVTTMQEPLEREPSATETTSLEQVSLTLELQEIAALPFCRVLVNGEESGCFQEQTVQLSLSEGDMLEIDATYYNFPIVFRVTSGSDNLIHPSLNQQFQVQQGIVLLGEVQANR